MRNNIHLDQERRKQLEKAFIPIDRMLNNQLVTVDLWEFMIPSCKELLVPLKKLKKIFAKHELFYFEDAVDIITKLLKDVLRGNVSCFFGLSNSLNIYLVLREAVQNYTTDESPHPSFDSTMVVFSKCYPEQYPELSEIMF
ncbi:MAG: hypothetical protein OEY59_13385 [Deltaproteobacteria bacterium]|nr:hypothetical protein [Deltaproteobacteria bacterium]